MKKLTSWLYAAVAMAAMAALSCCLSVTHAQQYPTKPVRLVHSFPPGGSTDLLARTVTQKMQESLGQNIIIETRPGAGTNIEIGRAHV